MAQVERSRSRPFKSWIKDTGYRILSSPPSVALTNWVTLKLGGGRLSHGGCVIDTNDEAVTPWARTLVFWKMYETAEIRFVEKYLDPSLDVVELGGSLGVVSAHIGRRLGPGRRMISVEANPRMIPLLRTNVEANTPHASSTVRHNAIAYGFGVGEAIPIEFGDSNLAGRVAASGSSDATCMVPVTTLSDLIREGNLADYALVSDIEGAEAGILIDDAKSLAGCRLMVIELHDISHGGKALSIADLARIIESDLGYSLVDQHKAVYVFRRK